MKTKHGSRPVAAVPPPPPVEPHALHVKLDRAELRAALARLAPLVERSPYPLLRLAVDPTGVHLTATDLRCFARVRTGATVGVAAEIGSAVLTMAFLRSLTRNGYHVSDLYVYPDGRARVGRTDGPTVRGGPGSEFPQTPDAMWASLGFGPVGVPAMIAAAAHAASWDDARSHLCGVNVRVDAPGGEVRVAATDGHRVARAAAPADALAAPMDVTIPRALVHAAATARGGGIGVARDATSASVWLDGTRLAWWTDPEGGAEPLSFPDVDHLFAGGEPIAFELAAAELALAALKVCGAFARDGRPVILQRGDGLAVAGSDAPETGASPLISTVTVRAGVSGEYAPRVGVNAGYLLDALAAAGDRRVTVRLGGERDPVVIEAPARGAAPGVTAVAACKFLIAPVLV